MHFKVNDYTYHYNNVHNVAADEIYNAHNIK